MNTKQHYILERYSMCVSPFRTVMVTGKRSSCLSVNPRPISFLSPCFLPTIPLEGVWVNTWEGVWLLIKASLQQKAKIQLGYFSTHSPDTLYLKRYCVHVHNRTFVQCPIGWYKALFGSDSPFLYRGGNKPQ